MDRNEWLNVGEAAAHAKCGKRSIYLAVERGALRAARLGGRREFRFLASGSTLGCSRRARRNSSIRPRRLATSVTIGYSPAESRYESTRPTPRRPEGLSLRLAPVAEVSARLVFPFKPRGGPRSDSVSTRSFEAHREQRRTPRRGDRRSGAAIDAGTFERAGSVPPAAQSARRPSPGSRWTSSRHLHRTSRTGERKASWKDDEYLLARSAIIGPRDGRRLGEWPLATHHRRRTRSLSRGAARGGPRRLDAQSLGASHQSVVSMGGAQRAISRARRSRMNRR